MCNFKRKLSFVLSLLMLAGMASCAASKDNTAVTEASSDTAAVTEEEEVDSLQARQKVSDGLGEYDFEGATFRILYQDYGFDAGLTEISGDSLEDAMYNRNAGIAQRFNVSFDLINGGEHTQLSGSVRRAVQSGDYAYDLVMNHVITTGSDIINDCYYDWSEIDNVDVSKPWYPQYAVSECTVNGKLYALVSDAALTSIENTYCIYFNKSIAADYGIDPAQMYTLVRDGGWTIDKLSEYTAMVYGDLNGNGKKDKEDMYGSNTLLFYSFNYLWAFDQPIASLSEDGISLVLNCEKTVNILDKLYDYYYNNEGVFRGEYMDTRAAFEEGRSLFLVCHFFPAIEELRQMEQEYGIIPYPKWNEAQQEYHTNIDGSFNVLVAPVSIPADSLTMVGTVTEALSAESWKNVMPVFYDITLKTKGARDEESVEMIDIILNGRVVDFSWMYTGFDGFNFILSDILSQKKGGGDFASYYEKREKGMIKVYEKAYDFFYDE